MMLGRPSGSSRTAAAIVGAAQEVFLTEGYESSSMDAIARHADVSKATLYAHFTSKGALFVAVMQSVSDNYQERLQATSGTIEGSFAERLTAVALTIIEFLLSPWALQMFRVVITESGRFPDITPEAICSRREKAERIISDIFSEGVASGELRAHDCARSGHLFMSMLRGDLLWEHLTDPKRAEDLDDVRARVDEAVQHFATLYALKMQQG